MKLQWKIASLVCGVLAIGFLVANVLLTNELTRRTQDYLAGRVTSTARLVASSDIVLEGLQGLRPESDIATYAAEVEVLANVDFVVVMDMDLIRKSHPVPSMIGQSFSAPQDAEAALKGKEYLNLGEGVLGFGKRIYTPVFTKDGTQIGVVVVGIGIEAVNHAIRDSRLNMYISLVVGLCVGIIGAGWLGAHVKKILFNLEPSEIAKLLKERDAMLNSVKEGIIAVDRDLNVTLINGEVERILQLDYITATVAEQYIRNNVPIFQEVLTTGKEQLHIEASIKDVHVIFSCIPISVENEVVGALATFQDKTELKKLGEELTGIQLYTDTLRAQSHEFMNKLHVILGLVQLENYEQLKNYITQVVHQSEREVNFIVAKIKCPVFAGFLLGKYSKAREGGIEFVLSEDSYLQEIKDVALIHQLIEIVGNLINNAMDALTNCPQKKIELILRQEGNQIYIVVKDTGMGISREAREQIFERGFSTHGKNRGLGLWMIQQTVHDLRGKIHLSTTVGKGTTFTVEIPYEPLSKKEVSQK